MAGDVSTAGRAAFELQISEIYARAGFEVVREPSFGGVRVDLLCTRGSGSAAYRIAVETKLYRQLAGVPTIEEAASYASILTGRGAIDEFHLVVSTGFTESALDRAARYGLIPLTPGNLREHLLQAPHPVPNPLPEPISQGDRTPALGSKKLFVLMPFDEDHFDLLEYGIAPIAEGHLLTAKTADDPQHNTGILAGIQQDIRSADVVLGIATGLNPNVMYEVGYGHGVRPPNTTILATHRGTPLASDLRDIHHLLYDSIRDFRLGFRRKLDALGLPQRKQYRF